MTTVFVSSVFEGLEDTRERLRDAILQAGDVPIGMEDFGARVEAPREVFLDEVQPADVVVLIVGPRYGSLDAATGISNTHLEFREAQRCGIPVLAFLFPEAAALSVDETSALHAFQDEVAVSAHTYLRLDDVNKLPERAMSGLKRFAEKRNLLPGQSGPFESADDFFGGLLDSSALFSHSYDLVGRRETLDQLDSFIEGSGFVAILPGSGGVGKSRILLELARCHAGVVFLGPQFELRPEHLRQLPAHAKCIVVDDAHRLQSLESLIQLAYTWFRRRDAGLRLIVTCRPTGLDRLRSAVRFLSGGILELPELLPLDAASHAYDLAIAVVGAGKPDLARALVKAADGNPLLITVGGQLLARDGVPPAMLAEKAAFRTAALNSLLSELPPTISGVSTGELLALLAAIGPVRPDREASLFDMLAKHLKTARSSVVSAMAALRREHRLLVQRGSALRVSPDVLGDHLLAQAALADGMATGFVEEVLDGFGHQYLSNILANASELEWRLRSGGSRVIVLETIWARLRGELPTLTHRQRGELLRLVEASAWFAPVNVWKIISWMLENPGAPGDPLKLLFSSPYSQVDVIERVPGIIRTLAWHDELASTCSRVLWDISADDTRSLNATPDHPLRVLGEVLAFDPHKPPRIQECALDGLDEALLVDEKRDVQRDVCAALSPLLSRALSWSVADGSRITMYSRALPAGNRSVVKIRGRAIGLIERQLASVSPGLAVRAVESLLDLLRPPIGLYGRRVAPEEIASWEKEADGVVDILLRVVHDPAHPTSGYSAKRGLERSMLRRSWPNIGQRLETVLGRLPDAETFVLYDALRPWAHLYAGSVDLETAEGLHTGQIRHAARYLLERADSPKERVARVCDLLEELRAAGLEPDPWRLLDCLCDLEPSSVPQLALAILDFACGPVLQQGAPVYRRWFEQEPRAALDEIGRRITMDGEDVSLGIARAYQQRWLGKPEVHTSEHVANISMLLASKHWSVRKAALMALAHAKGCCERQAVDILIAADFGDDADLLDSALLLINEEHGIPPGILLPKDITALLGKIRLVRELSGDHFHTGQFLQLAAAVSPEATIDMLLSRIEYAASLPDTVGEKYRPLPYAESDRGLDEISRQPEYANLLRRIRDRVREEHHVYRFWVPQLFALVSDSYGATAMDVLREWATSSDPEQVVLAAFLTREAGPGFAFTHDGFVAESLQNAVSLGAEVLRRVESNLHAGACSLSYSSSIGEAPDVMVRAKTRSEEMADKHKSLPVVEAFYKRLASSFQGHVRQGGVPRSPDPRRRHLRDELLQYPSFRLHATVSGSACLHLCQCLQRHVAACDLPLVVLFVQHRSDETKDRFPVGEDPDDVGPPTDLPVEPLLRVVRPDLPPRRPGKRPKRQDIVGRLGQGSREGQILKQRFGGTQTVGSPLLLSHC